MLGTGVESKPFVLTTRFVKSCVCCTLASTTPAAGFDFDTRHWVTLSCAKVPQGGAGCHNGRNSAAAAAANFHENTMLVVTDSHRYRSWKLMSRISFLTAVVRLVAWQWTKPIKEMPPRCTLPRFIQ